MGCFFLFIIINIPSHSFNSLLGIKFGTNYNIIIYTHSAADRNGIYHGQQENIQDV